MDLKEDGSVSNRLKAIRELMGTKYEPGHEDVLELTEDDLYDEYLDEDYVPDESANPANIIKKATDLNENLIQNLDNSEDKPKDALISDEAATQSIETLKGLIKKLEKATSDSMRAKNLTLEEVVTDTLKPYLKDWLSQYLHSIVQGIVDKEVQKLVINKD